MQKPTYDGGFCNPLDNFSVNKNNLDLEHAMHKQTKKFIVIVDCVGFFFKCQHKWTQI